MITVAFDAAFVEDLRVHARGEPLGLVSIFRDVTDLREANEELARNFTKLQQAEADSTRERDRLDTSDPGGQKRGNESA